MVSLLHLISYAGSITAFLFVTLSLASGLLWVAELIEEHSRFARVVGVRAIYAIIVLHALLYVFDGLPFLHIVFSILCHVVYLQHFSAASWPFISLSSPVFILSCIMVVADHFLWFFYFARVAQEAKRTRSARYRYSQQATRDAPSFMDVAVFFASCVWFIPLFLFLSLSANDNVIPSFDSSAPPSPMGSTVDLTQTVDQPSTPRRRLMGASLVKTVLTPIVNLLPSGRRSNHGIIAPPTPRAHSPAPAAHQGYSPWGESPVVTSPRPTGPEHNLGAASGRRATTPPSRPPRSRSGSKTNMREEAELGSPTRGHQSLSAAESFLPMDMGARNKAD
ncbi:hypothetical protein CspeluHIS016_0108280 [Cutaneotrichosporon spelunceum]|uniref:DUF396-domain-containing protein n=1 Tax=Cutaneotrichosporon spelunceum TaxID=1672016 RepID=A0AAD3TP94_9TREE|nr:hypothetical protein CspeluHIS016_0108280 [Cutaneotrichosporon spelunceum]